MEELFIRSIGSDRGFIASTDQQSLTGAGNLRVTLENPAGSGRNLHILSVVSVNTSSSTTFAVVRLNPTTGLPTTVKTPRSLILNRGTATIAVVKSDTSITTAIGGGTLLLDMPIAPGQQTHNSGMFVLEPGNTLGINVPFGGAASGQMIAYYVEE